MSKLPDFRVLPSPENKPSAPSVTTLFICPGMKDDPIEYAVFPAGDGCTSTITCPLRECCLWHEPHDFSISGLLDQFPQESIIDSCFRKYPFYCPRFIDCDVPKPRKRRKAKARLRMVAAKSRSNSKVAASGSRRKNKIVAAEGTGARSTQRAFGSRRRYSGKRD